MNYVMGGFLKIISKSKICKTTNKEIFKLQYKKKKQNVKRDFEAKIN